MKGYYIGMDGGGTGTTILVSSGGREIAPELEVHKQIQGEIR